MTNKYLAVAHLAGICVGAYAFWHGLMVRAELQALAAALVTVYMVTSLRNLTADASPGDRAENEVSP
ncbi:hypothetical protein ACFQGT_07515 [Natrialbaceae archaeon GCM10025810]|uniref:hypothetical protein n=1 Tax=Halovalidus salilacus TaxID=3075124 RepID=UPI003605F885